MAQGANHFQHVPKDVRTDFLCRVFLAGALVQATEKTDLGQVPKDAESLLNWMKQAETAMMRQGL